MNNGIIANHPMYKEFWLAEKRSEQTISTSLIDAGLQIDGEFVQGALYRHTIMLPFYNPNQYCTINISICDFYNNVLYSTYVAAVQFMSILPHAEFYERVTTPGGTRKIRVRTDVGSIVLLLTSRAEIAQYSIERIL